MLKILTYTAQVVALLTALVQAVESPGNGAEKKATVVAQASEMIAQLKLPIWAQAIFTNPVILGVLVDLIVAAAKKATDK